MVNKKILCGLCSILLMIVFALSSCDMGDNDSRNGTTPGNTTPGETTPGTSGTTPTPGATLPVSIGVNEVSGRTYFEGEERIIFSVTSAGTTRGTYTVEGARREAYTNEYGSGSTLVLENGKYKYAASGTGNYAWNETNGTITLQRTSIAVTPGATLLDRAQFGNTIQEILQERINPIIKAFIAELVKNGMTQAEAEKLANATLLINGLRPTEYIEKVVEEAFAIKIFDYSFSSDEKALFLQEVLPTSIGTNQLSGQTPTYYYDQDNEGYTFHADGTFAFTSSSIWPQNAMTGRYSYNSNRKIVYLRPTTVNGQTMTEFYSQAR